MQTGLVEGGKPSCLHVNTSSGVFAPTFTESQPDVASFLDIPFAEPPTGNLRFAPPVAKLYPGDDVVKASSLPPGCLQYVLPLLWGSVSLSGGPAREADFQYGDYSNTTEDCLRLSIFAPAASLPRADDAVPEDGPLPVVIWVHGGGLSLGGINTPWWISSNWVQRSQAHIMVHIQYRVNLLGLPNAAGLAEEGQNLNLAYLDQRLAVEWVRDNIEHFGGDPERITLWGESAGGGSVDSYLFAWARDPIIKGAIADSGNAFGIEAMLAQPGDYSTFTQVAGQLGCGNLSPSEELQCMRLVPESKLRQFLQALPGEGGASDNNLVFGVPIDNVTTFSGYGDRILEGFPKHSTSIPLITGTLTNEGAAIVPWQFEGTETATEVPATLAAAALGFKLGLQCTTLRDVRLRSEAGATTYHFLYDGNFTNVSPLPWMGAYHTAELPMIMGTHEIQGPSGEFERSVSERMQDVYMEFARDPANGPARAGWPPSVANLETSEVAKWAGDGRVEQVITAKELRDECVENGFEV
ncbi:Alpha/Beta hydrolase protein [Stachybotrys elegans]|uniref:Carboxylic ester hydrolase n=1 Tax=Stachybotrys elegans TaxID=80388 RepID=A0A8K0SD72_9HYPO|nr:Alpha/Beta hydrolase protein [Stachybotrys elegans]